MDQYKRSEILSGLFVVGAVVVFCLFSFQVGAFDLSRLLGKPRVSCCADFREARGLVSGSSVKVAGLDVGRVTGLRFVRKELTADAVVRLVEILGAEAAEGLAEGLTRQVVEISFEILDPTLRIDLASASVSVAKTGLLGSDVLALDPGFWKGEREPLLDRDVKEPLRLTSRESISLNQMVSQLAPAVKSIESILDTLDQELLSPANVEQLGATLTNLNGSVEEIRVLLDRENEAGLQQHVLDPLHSLLVNADQGVQDVKDRLLQQTLAQAEAVLADGQALVRSTDQAVGRAKALIEELGPRARQVVDELLALTSELDTTLVALRDDTQATLASVQTILTENQPQILETVRRLRAAAWEAEMALRKIRANPAYLLFGDDEQVLEQRVADEGIWRGSGRARPYGQRDENEEGN